MHTPIKFNLIVDEKPCRKIEQLQENFCIQDVLEHYESGKLQKWLKVREFDEHFKKVEAIQSKKREDIIRELVEIFEIEANEQEIQEASKDLSVQERIEKLKQEESEIKKNIEKLKQEESEIKKNSGKLKQEEFEIEKNSGDIEIRSDYYRSGNLSSTRSYKKGTDILHGVSVGFEGTGAIRWRETYKDGKRHGDCMKYDVHGVLEIKGTYKDGKKNGKWIEYDYGNNYIRKKGTYKNGKLINGEEIDE